MAVGFPIKIFLLSHCKVFFIYCSHFPLFSFIFPVRNISFLHIATIFRTKNLCFLLLSMTRKNKRKKLKKKLRKTKQKSLFRRRKIVSNLSRREEKGFVKWFSCFFFLKSPLFLKNFIYVVLWTEIYFCRASERGGRGLAQTSAERDVMLGDLEWIEMHCGQNFL